MPLDLFVCCELSYEGFGSFNDFYYILPVEDTLACYDYLRFRRDIEAKKSEMLNDQMKDR